MKKLTITLVSLLALLSALVFAQVKLKDYGIGVKSVDLEQTGMDLKADIERVKELQKKQFARSKEDEAYWEDIDRKMLMDNRSPEYVAKYLFATAAMGDTDLFATVFLFEQFNKDLFTVSNQDKVSVAKEMVNRITRNGVLDKIKIVDVEIKDSTKTAVVKALLLYVDGKKSMVNLKMVLQGTNHERNDEIFYVSNSVWDIIYQIESGIVSS